MRKICRALLLLIAGATQRELARRQCDFLSVKAITPKGFRDLFVLVFLHVETRRVYLSPATAHPNEAWVCDQARAFSRHVRDTGLGADIVMHERDAKFSEAFDAELRAAGLRVQKSAFRSPNTVAFVERFIQTLGQECLDYFVVFGEWHLNLCARCSSTTTTGFVHIRVRRTSCSSQPSHDDGGSHLHLTSSRSRKCAASSGWVVC